MTMTNTLTCRLDVLEGPQTLRYQELRKAMKGAGETRSPLEVHAPRWVRGSRESQRDPGYRIACWFWQREPHTVG